MVRVFCLLLAALSLSACVSGEVPDSSDAPQTEISQPTQDQPSQEESALKITVNGQELLATFADNSSAREFQELLAQGPLTVEMADYGGFEKVGALGTTLTRNDTQITTQPGDVILYQGNQITITTAPIPGISPGLPGSTIPPAYRKSWGTARCRSHFLLHRRYMIWQ